MFQSNFFTTCLDNFYVKETPVEEKKKPKSSKQIETIQKTETTRAVPAVSTLTREDIVIPWRTNNIPDPEKTIRLSVERKDNVFNASLIHSILCATDPIYLIRDLSQRKRDCMDALDLIREQVLKRVNITKEHAEAIRLLSDGVHTDETIQMVVNFFKSFHLLVFYTNSEKTPRIYTVQSDPDTKRRVKPVNTHETSSQWIPVLFDDTKECFYPIVLEGKERFWISWKEPEYMDWMQRIFYWSRPQDFKKWLVADLRNYIQFFALPIDPTQDKKTILEELAKYDSE